MNAMPKRGIAAVLGLGLVISVAACSADETDDPQPDGSTESASDYTVREVSDGTTDFVVVQNPNDGATLSYSVEGGIELIEDEVDGVTYAFKDMNGNGELDLWEDWRESNEDRAADLAPQLSSGQVAGLMLFSDHERSPAEGLTDEQREYLSTSHLRNVLSAGSASVEDHATWSNSMQAHVETLVADETPYVPVNFSTDPRHDAGAEYMVPGEGLSQWPSNLGLAATNDPALTQLFAEMASAEYRALGLTTALSPQIDLATDPRWSRVAGTFGEDVDLTTAMATAYMTGFQDTTDESGNNIGWGKDSVNAMLKHFPSDGMGEDGRESHNDPGKYSLWAGDNLDTHLKPFLANLDSAAMMTSYSIALDENGDPKFGELVGTAYNKELVDMLRVDNDYDGVLVTDWGVTDDRPWGMEHASVDEQHYGVIQSGHDIIGGVNDVGPILAAFDMWQADFEAGKHEIDAAERFAETGSRVLKMIFNVGLYDNPYLDVEQSVLTAGSEDKVQAGIDAQRASVVMLKNDGSTIARSEAEAWSEMTAYIPSTLQGGGRRSEPEAKLSLSEEAASKYFAAVVTDEITYDDEGNPTSYTAPDLSGVDIVLLGMASPNNGGNNGGWNEEDGYIPLSLQYRPYVADGPDVREVSLGGNILPDGTKENRSYLGKTSKISNEGDLDAFERAVDAVEASGRDIPVIVALKASNATIPAEFEPASDAVLVGFGISDEALIEVALGIHEPQGRLPIDFPANMETVEAQLEDVAMDVETYTDAAGNSYAVGFGLSWSGVIE